MTRPLKDSVWQGHISRLEERLMAGEAPVDVFRQAIRDSRADLEQAFWQSADITALVRAHAALVDALMQRAWRLHACDSPAAMALIAVGGYGRGELHPYSDIDLMILGEAGILDEHADRLQALLTFLWDLGLDVGHSVRSPEDCIEQARADITVATNLMESRLLCGNEALYQSMREATGRDRLWPGRAFFEAKWQEQIRRHHRFNDTAYNLEPNIKEGPGGLRDIQMIGWVAKRHFGADTLEDLVGHGFLTGEEHQALLAGQRFLWKVRYGLHCLAGRREDRLLFDHQRALAKRFGYPDTGPRLPVEQFMKDYYRTVMELERLNEMLLTLFQEEILYADEQAEPVPVNKRFQAIKGFIEAVDERIFERYPFAMLEIFLVMAEHPELKGVRAGTIRLLRQYTDRIDDAFRQDIRCRSLFIELFRQPRGLTHELRRMNRYGILAAYLPEFGRIVGQMQHDLFHVYTVDEHTLFVVRNLRRLTVPEFGHEHPLASRIIKRIPKPELVYIAALYHDIAKGRGGDHSELGAVDAEAFCRRHELSAYDTRLVCWLVRNHLIMSTTAQRRDISDPEVINRFAEQVGDTTYLDYLYLLTTADIRATSPKVWNSWKATLLAELYQAAFRALRRGLGNPLHEDELIADTQQQARDRLHALGLTDADIDRIWSRMSREYFLRYSAGEITWHTGAILGHADPEAPLVLARQMDERGGTEIFIYTPIRGHLFSTITGALEQLGLNIQDARIIPSRDGYALDCYIVLENDGEPIRDPRRAREIEKTLSQRLRDPEPQTSPVQMQITRQLKHFPLPVQVGFQDDPGNQRTIVEVVASDRPGLLTRIARALGSCNVHMQNAKITTLGERAEDIFFITDENGQPLDDPERQTRLRQAIIENLEDQQDR